MAEIQAPAFSAQSVRVHLSGAKLETAEVEVGRATAGGRPWPRAKLSCPGMHLSNERVACSGAVLEAGAKIPLSFTYLPPSGALTAEAKPGGDETWNVAGRLAGAQKSLDVRLQRAQLVRLAAWLPPAIPKIGAGTASGTLSWRSEALKARLDVSGLAFADASGLHAGDKIAAAIEAEAAQKDGSWRWNGRLQWKAGEAFWQPLYVQAKGQVLSVEGTTARGASEVRSGTLELPNIGTVAFTARYDHDKGRFSALDARSARVRLAALYDEVLKSLLQGTALADMRSEGEAGFSVTMGAAGLTSAQLELRNVSFEDRQRRFAVFGLNGRVPWRADQPSAGELAVAGAEFLKVPVGAVKVPLRVRGTRVDIDSVRVPVLDGAVSLRDFAAGRASDGWRWRFAGEVASISMLQLTQAFGLPVMHGTLGGTIPELRYRRGTVSMDGALVLKVFDGTVSASKVELIDPFGRAPRLHAEVDMKNLDLEVLTRALDFGSITGRADARIAGLELVGWQPVRFDARIASSEGRYPRRISQRAVQNISALGGAGAAAAIQRSVLRFFDEFGYERIGFSCRLEGGVCEMDGIERAPQGFVIVKGGGIPAISVIGYNRAVDWRELVDRLKRATGKDVKPIVK